VRRRRTLLALAALLAGVPAFAQKPRPVPRIGILILASLASVAPLIEGFRASFRKLGYVEGRTISIEILSAEGNAERLPELAAELVKRKVDVIITGGGNVSTLAARKATTTIPIVMMSSVSAVESGLVHSLARPGGNVTGLTVPQDLGMKQIQLVRELIFMAAAREQAKATAQQLMLVTVDFFEVRSPDDLVRALEAARAAKPEAMIVAPDPLLYQQRAQILRFTRAARIPDMYFAPEIVDDGGLVAYSPAPQDIFSGVARFVDRLLKGAKPAELPVEQPTRFELTINLKTAKSLGLAVPQSVLLRADRVVE
jgi:putative ABC transport system substrate-binding protein